MEKNGNSDVEGVMDGRTADFCVEYKVSGPKEVWYYSTWEEAKRTFDGFKDLECSLALYRKYGTRWVIVERK